MLKSSRIQIKTIGRWLDGNRIGVLLAGSLLLLCSLVAASPEDWPQWQGPDRDAISKEQGLLQQWGDDGPPLFWKVKGLGGGDSTPSIAGGKVFGMSHQDDSEVVWALSEKDGSTLWVTKLGQAFEQEHRRSKEGPGSTPTVDGDRLYVVGLGGNIACLQVSDGKLVWERSMVKDFGGKVPTWSYRESPLIDGNKVICTPGGDKATIVALDKLTGKTIWECLLSGAPKAAYASAIAFDFGGQRQYAQFTANTVVGVAASDGKVLWSYDAPANSHGINCATPIYQDGKVFASSAYGNGGGLVQLAKNEDGDFKAEEVYFTKRMQNHHGGMIVHEGYLFGASGGNSGGYIACLNFQTGDVMWDERRGERRAEKGSVALADGRLYYRTEDGIMLLLEPSPEGYIEHGRLEQPRRSDKPAWAHPVIANGKLYLRDQNMLFCYDVKAQ